MNTKVVFVAIVLLVLPFSALFVQETDAEIEVDGTLQSYYYDGNYVYITQTIKTDSQVYLEDGSTIDYTEVRVEYRTNTDTPESLVGLKYYTGNVLVYSEDRDFRQNLDTEQLEVLVDGQWVEAISDQEITPLSLAGLVKFGKMLWDKLSEYVGKISVTIDIANWSSLIASFFVKPDDHGEYGYHEYRMTDDIIILRSNVNASPLAFVIEDVVAPALPFNDETLMNLEPFTYYLVLGYTQSPAMMRAVCPIGFGSNIAAEILDMNYQMYNIWTATGDMADSVNDKLREDCIIHDNMYCGDYYSHFHYIDDDGHMSLSRSFYGLSDGKSWQPADGEQWWFD